MSEDPQISPGQCCGYGMFIPVSESGFSLPDPGSKRHRIRGKTEIEKIVT
jgi:hypothetical protein